MSKVNFVSEFNSIMRYARDYSLSLRERINFKYVASQLLNTLVGSFGLIAAAPLTVVIGGVFLTRKGSRDETDAAQSNGMSAAVQGR